MEKTENIVILKNENMTNFLVEDDIKMFYEKVLRHSQETEVRALIPGNKKDVRNLFIHNCDNYIQACRELNQRYNIYSGINERRPGGKDKEDVISVGIIPLDIDCTKAHEEERRPTDQEIAAANQVSDNITNDFVIYGYKKPVKIYSGGGYQLLILIPKIEITDKNRDEVENKIKEFINRIIAKYSTDMIKIDQVGDLPRIMRVPGTYNLKSKVVSRIVSGDFEEDSKLKEDLLNIELTKILDIEPSNTKKSSLGLSNELKETIDSDSELKELFEWDDNMRSKFNNDKSDAEMSLCEKLISRGFDWIKINEIMCAAQIGKWLYESANYRDRTYKKAVQFATTLKDGWEDGKKVKGTLDLIKEKLEAEKNPFWTWDELRKLKTKKKDWIITPLISSGDIIIFVGEANIGKSWVALSMAVNISRGISFLGFETKKCGVAYIPAEDGEDLFKDRILLDLKGHNLRNIKVNLHILKDDCLGSIDSVEWIKNIIDYAHKNNIKIIFLDTFRRLTGIKENSSDDVNELYKKLRMFSINKIAVVLIHHASEKGKGTYRGSTDIKGMCTNMFSIKKDSKNKELLWFNNDKMKYGRKLNSIAFKNIITDEGYFLKMIHNKQVDEGKKKTKENILKEKVNKIIGTAAIKKKEIMQSLKKNKIKFSEPTLRRAIDELLVEGVIKRAQFGEYIRRTK